MEGAHRLQTHKKMGVVLLRQRFSGGAGYYAKSSMYRTAVILFWHLPFRTVGLQLPLPGAW